MEQVLLLSVQTQSSKPYPTTQFSILQFHLDTNTFHAQSAAESVKVEHIQPFDFHTGVEPESQATIKGIGYN